VLGVGVVFVSRRACGGGGGGGGGGGEKGQREKNKEAHAGRNESVLQCVLQWW